MGFLSGVGNIFVFSSSVIDLHNNAKIDKTNNKWMLPTARPFMLIHVSIILEFFDLFQFRSVNIVFRAFILV